MAYDKVIDSAVLDADLTAVANAIRTKGGTTDPLAFPDGFVSAVEGISAGGGEVDPYADMYKSVFEGTVTHLAFPEDYTDIRAYQCYGLSTLKSADFSNTKVIGYMAFAKTGLTSIEIPGALEYTAFGASCFSECSNLVSVSMPNATWMQSTYQRQFEKCTSLKNINMPLMTKLGGNCFYGCTALESIYLPSLTESWTAEFNGCTMLSDVNLPVLTSIGSNMFTGCTALEFVDFPCVTAIANNAFSKCSNLKTLVLRSGTLATLASAAVFANTPFASGGTGGTVYVPSALIESYQTATNWSTLYAAGTCNFVAIEGSEYE